MIIIISFWLIASLFCILASIAEATWQPIIIWFGWWIIFFLILVSSYFKDQFEEFKETGDFFKLLFVRTLIIVFSSIVVITSI